MYYDNRARLIQTHSSNHLGGKESGYVAYNFTGQPVKKLHVHSSGNMNMNSKQELYTYTYDHAGRLVETTHQLDNASPIVLAKNEYDELGRLKNVKRADNENLQTNYTYNIRSWTKSISSPLFTQNLYYNEEREGNTPSYNGNISRIEWTNAGSNNKAYNFGYDALSQLKTANYTGAGEYGANYSYDKHGNMLTLEHKGKTNTGYGTVDQLTMSYKGNQLTNVKDAGVNVGITQSADFKDYSDGKGVYEYNNNGAMTKDLHKGISKIEYNSLNLPMVMDIKSPVAEARNEYLYSATGVKLRVKQRWNSNFSTTPIIGTGVNQSALDVEKVTDYVGNKIYEDGKLIKILVDGGYYDVEQKKYYFYIQDHLGNNRVVADAEGNVVQRSDYYPFGMEFADNTDQDEQPYKYNGKELDKMHGLNMYDYSARYMEPAIGRFTSVDPLAEKYYSISPYAYVGNNPLRLVDVNGKEWGIRVNANGTQTIILRVNLSVSSNLSTAQVDAYKTAMSTQLHSTIYAASGELYSAEMSFDGGTDPNRFTPTIVLDDSTDGMALGMYSPGSELVSLYPNKAQSLLEFGETSIHELFHTLNIDDVAASPYISDTKMTSSPNGYLTTPGIAKNIHKNVMNYPQTKIDGKSYKQIYNSTSGMNQLTKGQLNFLIRSLYKQMGGYGQKPVRQKNESDLEYAKRYKKYYEDYWNNPEDM